MLKLRGDADLALESVRAENGAQLGTQHLDRDLTVVLEVPGQVDGRHAAAAELPIEGVAVGDRGLQAGGDVGQGERWRAGHGRTEWYACRGEGASA